jgi:plasmid stabilization system protein ParE
LSFELHKSAAEDLAAAARFYRGEGGVALAMRFLKEFERVVDLLQEHPEIGTPTGGERRMFPLAVFPYSVIYRKVGGVIRVLVVRHQRRSPAFGERRR